MIATTTTATDLHGRSADRTGRRPVRFFFPPGRRSAVEGAPFRRANLRPADRLGPHGSPGFSQLAFGFEVNASDRIPLLQARI
jgi:hypothetical protein